MSALDSVAVLKSRMAQLGLLDLWDNFEGHGWTSLGSFAFAVAASYGGTPADEQSFQDQIARPLFGDAHDPRIPAIRRLHFEAADLHRRSTRSEEDDKPKIMPPPERSARLAEVRAAIPGLEIEGDLEPSDTLVDKFSHMQEVSGVLRYMPLEEMGRRDNEVRGIKKDTFWKTDANGSLKLHEVGVDAVADLSSDYKLHRTLMRRGVAMHMAHLVSFKVHDQLTRWLMKEMHREPVPGYQKVSIGQIHRVDQEIFLRLAEETRSGLASTVSGDCVLDAILPGILLEPRIVAFLNPLPSGTKVTSDPAGSKRGPEKELARLREENKKIRAQMTNKGAGKRDGDKGKGKKRKHEAERGTSRMPQELIGLPSKVDGVRACFDYNMQQGCKQQMDGNGACSHGKHVCLRCGSTGHGAQSSRCPKR